MYNHHFGFTERPFKLVPNPAYLFLSTSHEEALAHLAYAVDQGDGFAVIIGEVGTGKTTLCRVFLDRLDATVKPAYIFNPKLNSVQLLQAINDEFGLSSQADNTKELIDTLNGFLLHEKGEGRKPLILIDEAQNLTLDVLEQLRLLSNLETSRDKLLQIILVGQPELGELLDSHELRQLRQRITLSCMLLPFSLRETRDYIEHRINLASRKPGTLFDRSACRVIHAFAGGVPRLINIACDRALLTAFGRNKQRITSAIAGEAIRELKGRWHEQPGAGPGRRLQIFALFLLLAALASLLLLQPGWQPLRHFFTVPARTAMNPPAPDLEPHLSPPQIAALPKSTAPASPQEEIEEAPASAPGTQSIITSAPTWSDLLGRSAPPLSRRHSLRTVLRLWGTEITLPEPLEERNNDRAFFQAGVRQYNLQLEQIQGDLDLLRSLNLPAILQLSMPAQLQAHYLTLCAIETDTVQLCGTPEGMSDPLTVPIAELRHFWTGIAYLPWRNFLGFKGLIPIDTSKDGVLNLKRYLQQLGYTEIELTPVYDQNTREAIQRLQKKYGITVDGLVGTATKIVLYHEDATLTMPRLTQGIQSEAGL